jgi:hypothetical protein
MRVPLLVLALLAAASSFAADVGLVKVAAGKVQIERGGKLIDVRVGTSVQAADVLRTGPDGAAGITFTDNSLLSIGPNSVLAIDKYEFDTTTNVGAFDTTLKQGRLAAVSGKMVKQSPESMKVRTPASVMGVRGTEFVVQVDELRVASR